MKRITIKHASEMTGISVPTLRRMILDGEKIGHAVRTAAGHSYIIYEEDVINWLGFERR